MQPEEDCLQMTILFCELLNDRHHTYRALQHGRAVVENESFFFRFELCEEALEVCLEIVDSKSLHALGLLFTTCLSLSLRLCCALQLLLARTQCIFPSLLAFLSIFC